MSETAPPPSLHGFTRAPSADPTPAFQETAADQAITPSDLVQLQASLATQPSLQDAMRALVIWLHERLPQANVRVAWGRGSPKAMIDGRLGKLGRESQLWDAVVSRWPEVSDTEEPLIDGANTVWLRIPSGNEAGHVAVLWMESQCRAADLGRQLRYAGQPLGSVLWSRPRLKLATGWLSDHSLFSWPAMMLTAVLVLLALFPVSYRVNCHAIVQPYKQRIVAAPFEATLLECYVEPGDEVQANQLLLRLDGRPLRLELEALQADHSQAIKQHSSALATGKIAESQLAELERRQLEKRIELYENRLERLDVRSPIHGIVVSGDLARSVGVPLEIGEPLLEIAPLKRMLVELEVPEEEIHYVCTGAPLRVRLDAAIHQPLEGKLQRLFPQAEVRQERNVFVGRWEIENGHGWLRPGMQGNAVIYGPKYALAWPWVRRLQEAALRAIGW